MMIESHRVRRLVYDCLVPVFVLIVFVPLLYRSAAWAIDIDIGLVPPVEVYFSPRNGGTAAIVREIDRSRSEILIQAYSFTSAPIADSLRKAHKRGVKVSVILDKSQKTQKYSSATFLMNALIPIYIDAEHAIAHNKIILIDQSVVITGSFNFTRAAEEKNAENLLIIRSKELARPYLENWQRHRDHSAAQSLKPTSAHWKGMIDTISSTRVAFQQTTQDLIARPRGKMDKQTSPCRIKKIG
jgi:phosphatidylserine/phosphatidylglycerophosphate/cardiolipin synthase-like enzyme